MKKNEPSIPFVYLGDPCRLGRFGEVKSGQLLILNDHEAETVLREEPKRFKPAIRMCAEAIAAGTLDKVPVEIRRAAEDFSGGPIAATDIPTVTTDEVTKQDAAPEPQEPAGEAEPGLPGTETPEDPAEASDPGLGRRKARGK